MSLGLTYSTFANDEFGSTARSPGKRIIPQASWSLPLGNNNLSLYAWDIYRNATEDPADPTIVDENTFTLGAMLSLRAGRNSLRPLVEFRRASAASGGPAGSGSLVGAGLRYVIGAGRLSVIPGVRMDFGSRTTNGTSTSFTGFTGGLSIRTSF